MYSTNSLFLPRNSKDRHVFKKIYQISQIKLIKIAIDKMLIIQKNKTLTPSLNLVNLIINNYIKFGLIKYTN